MRSSAIVPLFALLAGCSSSITSGNPADLHAARVDSPAKSHRPTPNAAGTRTEEYFGGPVIPNAKVYAVWWGNPSNLNSAITAAHGGIADFFAGVTNSSFVDWLNEYDTNINAQAGSHSGSPGTNQFIGRGNYVSAITLAGVQVTGTVTDAQIQTALNNAFTAGTLPAPDANTIYAIYFPSSVSISLDGSSSCIAFGAYHEALIGTSRANAWYLVIPDCGDSFSGTTVVSSHELAEAITDGIPTPGSNPDYPQAWNDSGGNEVGDLCESSSGTVSTPLGSFSVQGIWDERSQGCKVFTSAAQDFNLALSPNSATLANGASSTFTVQTATVAGAAQSLTLSAVAPAGITATVSPSTVTSGGTATLTVSAVSSAATAGLQVVVRADAASGNPHTAALLLSVTGAAGNDFSLTASPGSASAAPGGSASFSIATAVTSGSAQTVNLSLAGLPSGATASFSPSSLSAGSGSSLVVNVGSATPQGSYPLTITGTGASATHTASVTLAVEGALTTAVTAPADGATVSASVTVTATASSGANKLELYVDGALLATGASSPFSAAWDSTQVADGAHQLTSKAYDSAGGSATSAAVNVTVSNGGGTTQCPPGTVNVGGTCVPTGCSPAGIGGLAGGVALLLLAAFARARRRSAA